MKKGALLTVVASVILLSNISFASAKTVQTKHDTTTITSSTIQDGRYHLNTTDPH